MSTNEYGLDVSYMNGKLNLFLRDIDRHTPDEAARVLARLAMVADENVLREPEFSERDTYRDLCAELLNEIKTAVVYAENNIGAIDHLKKAITKAESILGEKNGR